MKRTYILIDGGHLRASMKDNDKCPYNAKSIEKLAHSCVQTEEELLKILFYDCEEYEEKFLYLFPKKKNAIRAVI